MIKLTRLGIVLLLSLLLSGCRNGWDTSSKAVVPNTVDTNPQDWGVFSCLDNGSCSTGWSSVTNPVAGTAPVIWTFQFPNQNSSANYITVPYQATENIEGKTFSLTFEVESNSPTYGLSDPSSYGPISLHLFLQRYGDDMSGSGVYAYYRWLCGDSGYILGSADNQIITVSCLLVSTSWSGVIGGSDSTDFQDTLDNMGRVGFTLGGSGGWGHGVYMTDGTATFELMSATIQ